MARERERKPLSNSNRHSDVAERLLLIRSDCSRLILQVDQLLALAAGNEIQSLGHVLSQMQASFKQWVPEFQKAISNLSITPSDSPERYSLVSPSPLVSWRAGCMADAGRQLFLLTPLPKPSSKCHRSSINMNSHIRPITGDLEEHKKPMSTDTATQPPPSLSDLTLEMDKSNEVMSVANKVYGNDMTQKTDIISPVKLPQKDTSLLVMTPLCLKMSPPKSCILLEPLSAYNCRDSHRVYKMTPFPARQDSESSSSEAAEHLTFKYPELHGIMMLGEQNLADESPNWNMSPPKTCVLMEPPVAATETCNKSESSRTPVTVRTGSVSMTKQQHPGEDTLKKELWEKFEAASFTQGGIRFIQNKGFLERLEEVSHSDDQEH